MIVYGDHSRNESPRITLAELAATVSLISPQRSAAATRFLIRAGELCQGLLDWKIRDGAPESWGNFERACSALLAEAADAFVKSCEEKTEVDPLQLYRALARVAAQALPDKIRIKLPEGYAFYCVHPKSYWRAAQDCGARFPGHWITLGLRSIGTSLAAVVAHGLDASTPPITLRPTGSPFARTISVSEELADSVLSDPLARYAIVDEGPGLSGSSFGALADWLEERGVPWERIHFFPSHSGEPGPQSSARHRKRWTRAHRHAVEFDQLRKDSEAFSFLEDAEDLSAGKWREKSYPDTRDWPPVHPQKERLKFLLEGEDGSFMLAKFAGLGGCETTKIRMAEKLSTHGFTPRFLGYREGFLLEEWIDCARTFDPNHVSALKNTVAAYVTFRAREFQAPGESGAAPASLLEMMLQNSREELGSLCSERLRARWQNKIASIARRVRPIRIDGRMHAWEWLQTVDGRWLKCDALDHHQTHDCIGAQDVAWDIAGARVELGLELDFNDSELLAFCIDAYLAFHLGASRMAADALLEPDREEAWRLERQAERYAAMLEGPGIANG